MKRYLILISAFLVSISACFAQDRVPKDNWCVQKATDQNDALVFITVNLGYKDYAYKGEFPWGLSVNITTMDKNANGHPTQGEAAVLNETEDILTAALQKAGIVHLVGRVTVNGYRELYYFVADPEKANAVLTRLTKKRQPRPWEYHMEQDEKWQRVEPFFGNSDCL